jgi:hypothetical protein
LWVRDRPYGKKGRVRGFRGATPEYPVKYGIIKK